MTCWHIGCQGLTTERCRGSKVCTVGEWRGHTGDDALSRLLLRDFRLDKRVPLPNWTDTAHELTIWQRRQPEVASREPSQGALPAAALAIRAACKDAAGPPRQPAAVPDGTSTSGSGSPSVPVGAGEPQLAPLHCWTCGSSGDGVSADLRLSVATGRHADPAVDGCQLRRCQYCREVAFCSAACAAAGERTHRQAHALRLIFFAECQPEFDTDADYEGLPAL